MHHLGKRAENMTLELKSCLQFKFSLFKLNNWLQKETKVLKLIQIFSPILINKIGVLRNNYSSLLG